MRGPIVSAAYSVKDLVGERHAGGLAAAGQQRLAEFDQTVGFALPAPRRSRRISARLAVGDALQHLAEERGVHRNHPTHPYARHQNN